MTNFKEIIERLENLPWQSEIFEGDWVYTVRSSDAKYTLPLFVLYANCLMYLGLGGRLCQCDPLDSWARIYYCFLLRNDTNPIFPESLDDLLEALKLAEAS